MVVHSPRTDLRDDQLLRALCNATRRDIVAVALRGERSVSELARRYPMSMAAVQKHVAVLERAGLVVKHRRGREQQVSARIEGVHAAARLLEELEEIWRSRMDRFGEILAERESGDSP